MACLGEVGLPAQGATSFERWCGIGGLAQRPLLGLTVQSKQNVLESGPRLGLDLRCFRFSDFDASNLAPNQVGARIDPDIPRARFAFIATLRSKLATSTR